MCGSVSGGEVCYSGDSVGSVAVFFCDDGYTLESVSPVDSGMEPLLNVYRKTEMVRIATLHKV